MKYSSLASFALGDSRESIAILEERLAGLEVNYTYVESQFRQREIFSDSNIADEGDSIPLVPKHRLSVMGHLYPIPGLTLSLIGLYVSTQFAQGDEANAFERIPGYFVLNGRASYETKVPGGRLTAYLLLNNLTDHEYSTFGTASLFGRTFVPAQSISIYGGLSYRFEGFSQ
jgi:outer membrane receptor for monomeric catechols